MDYDQFNGDICAFIEAVYAVFKHDFIDSRPIFDDKPLSLKKRPFIEGKEYTFYHLTSEGDNENDRVFNIGRAECITFVRAIIDNINHPYLKVWCNKRKGKERTLIFHEEESYLVVLEKRKNYTLLWTAYQVTRTHTYNKLMKEYKEYEKSKDRHK